MPLLPVPAPSPRGPSQGSINSPDNRNQHGPGGVSAGEKARQNIMAMQRFLIARGYDIRPSGQLDARTKSAVNNWHKGVGKRNPKAWSASPFRVPNNIPDSGVRPKPKPVTRPTAGGGGGGAPGGGGGSAVPTTTRPVQGGGGRVGVGSPFGADEADNIAGLQFDPQIRDAETLGRQLPVQGAQNLADIKNWYNQVLASQGKAAVRDAAITQEGIASVGGATSSILGSLGGTANQGAGMIGAAGVDAAASLGSLGASNAQYQEDIRPLLEAESSGVSARELALQRNRSKEVANQILNLRGQRGQAEAVAGMDIQKYNDSLKQQGFQNELAIEQTVAAAKGLGADLTSQGLRDQLMRRDLNQTPPDPGAFVPWDKIPLPDRANMVGSIMGNVLGPQGGLIMNPKQTYAAARKRAVSMGYNSPQLLAMIRVGINEAWARSKARGEWRKAKPV